MYDHPKHHAPSADPVPGCPDCDWEIARPVLRRHGQGSGTVVIPARPPPPEPKEE